MKERIKAMREFFVVEKQQRKSWQIAEDPYILANQYQEKGISDIERATERLIYVLKKEKPVVYRDERIAFTRTVKTIPELYTKEECAKLKEEHWIHERGDVCNINVDYTMLLDVGIVDKLKELEEIKKNFELENKTDKVEYLSLQIKILEQVLELAKAYRQEAIKVGNQLVAQTLATVPAKAPESFLEALQMFRIIHYVMWCGNNYHNTIGRFDQYIYPYLKADMEKGVYDEESALELVEEFFLTFNRDSDLYPGMQQGDNGQSMVLGGLNEDGSDSYNILSELCLNASLELKLIDPKINLRVHKKTPMDTYVLGTKLTKQGLGFPQYSNDDVVIPGLIKLGYDKQDAYNYVMAACWEFIVPGVAMDIPNIESLSFTDAVEKAVFSDLTNCDTYQDFEDKVKGYIKKQVDILCERVKNIYMYPAPYLSIMMHECSKMGKDISKGAKYNNYGFHGTGLSTATDSLAAIRKYVYEENYIDAKSMLEALGNDFVGYEELCNKLRYETPKMGNNDDYVDGIAVMLLETFAKVLEDRENDRGGIYRAGTGSAMYYIWQAKEMGATPDGRHKGEGFGCNYSPSIFSKCRGPVSIIQSFTKPDLRKTINGGPLTLELHDTLFRNEDSIYKTATMVKSFIDLKGHQLQLNAVNKDVMLDAQKHPEHYRNLIVRVWGWSGYFVELDKEYQDHIIQRMELTL